MGNESTRLDAQFNERRRRMLVSADPRPLLWIALGVLLFNLWDRWLDAPKADLTLCIRLGVAALLCACWLLLRRPAVAVRWAASLYATAFLGTAWGIVLAILPLQQGWAFGMPALLLFPLTLAFYPLPPSRFLAINTIALSGLLGMLVLHPVRPAEVINFFLLYVLAMWIGSVALRVQQRQQLRLYLLERRHAESARTDALTGLANRRSLEELGVQRLAAARRQGRPLAVLMFDLDHFKQINDRHGHDVGDRALVHAARQIGLALREGDLLGRWGGEEFLAVLDDADLERAGDVAQRCIDRLATTPLALADSLEVTLGSSVGVAEWRSGESLDALVKRADSALYAAKQGGRGRFELAR